MKKLILTLMFSFIISYISFGEIRMPYAHIWPETDEISRNPVFVISEYRYSGTLIKNLNIKHNIYLKSDGKRIALKVIKLIINDRLQQAIVKPNELLEKGESYELVIENAEYYRLSHYNWKVSRLIDKVKPVWSQQPFYLGNNFTCEDLSFRQPVFSTCTKDRSKVVLLTKLKNKEDGSIIEYIKPAG